MKKTIYVSISGGVVQDFGSNFENDFEFKIFDFDDAECDDSVDQLEEEYDTLVHNLIPNKVFEVVLKGYDDQNSDTDHLVLWVASESINTVKLYLRDSINKIESIKILSMTPNKKEGLDFIIPMEVVECEKKIKELYNSTFFKK